MGLVEQMKVRTANCQLKLSRCLLFIRISNHGTNSLLITLATGAAHQRSWINAVAESWAFFTGNSTELADFKHFHIRDWCQWAREDGKTLRRRLIHAANEGFCNTRHSWSTQSKIPEANATTYVCEMCGDCFYDYRALQVHKARKHAGRAKVLRFVASSTCIACLKCFDNRGCVHKHLNQSVRCWSVYESCARPLTDEELGHLDAEWLAISKARYRKGLCRHSAEKAVRLCSGPLRKEAIAANICPKCRLQKCGHRAKA